MSIKFAVILEDIVKIDNNSISISKINNNNSIHKRIRYSRSYKLVDDNKVERVFCKDCRKLSVCVCECFARWLSQRYFGIKCKQCEDKSAAILFTFPVVMQNCATLDPWIII